MNYRIWIWRGIVIIGISVSAAQALTGLDEGPEADAAMPAAELAAPAGQAVTLPVSSADQGEKEKIDVARQVKAALDHPLVVPSPASGDGAIVVESAPRSYSIFSSPTFVGLALFVIVILVFTWRRFRPSLFEPHVSQAVPRAADVAPRLEIIIADQSDYPTMTNDVFMASIAGKDIIAPAELELLAKRFNKNSFAILLQLVQRAPAHKSLLGRLWGDSLGVAYVDPLKTTIQYEKLAFLADDFLQRHPVLALYELDGVLTVATYNPTNTDLVKEIEGATGKFVSPVFTFPDQIAACLAIGRATVADLANSIAKMPSGSAILDEVTGAPNYTAGAQTIVNFARDLMLLAMRKRASDIHIEPNEEDAVVRFRIDGILEQIMRLNLSFLPALINVIKIRAGVDIADRRRPQDGHLSLELGGNSLDFRYSSVPTIYGEKIVLRLLGQDHLMSVPDLDQLGCSKIILENMRRIIHSPNGVFFVTGPTGSGKTTTLYAALKSINRRGLNIMTVEDPVEYHLPDINQVQVNPAAGVTFATALRAFLRQDPDVILVGEVRDLETAKVAAQAALTGHLVLTTMHTNNALQAITRLIQIGVEPFLVAPSIIGVMAQRLVRKLCPACRERYQLTSLEVEALFISDGKTEVHAWHAKGCQECNFTGYMGRIAIQELFVIDDETRELIAHDATILDIKKTAYTKGFTTMRRDGIKKVLRGLTTMQEVDNITMEDE